MRETVRWLFQSDLYGVQANVGSFLAQVGGVATFIRAQLLRDAPDGLKYWLTEYGRQIQWLRDHPDQATPYKIRRASYPDIEPLVSAAWTQRAPSINSARFGMTGELP